MTTSLESICPRCNTTLTADAADPLHLRCGTCSGVLIRDGAVIRDLLDQLVIVDAPTNDDAAIAGYSCPACRLSMQQAKLGDAELLRCPACGAVWLDEGAMLPNATSQTSGGGSLSRYLLYSLSLPERAVRSTVGLAAGAARETAAYLVPKSFQSSKTYEIMISNSLKFLTDDIGGVKSTETAQAPAAENYLARKAVGNFVDLAGLATLHLSPLWMLSIVSDVAYGSKSYLNELAGELKREGLIAEDSTIGNMDDMLTAIQHASGETATLFDTPPLSVDELRSSLDKTRESIRSMDFRAVLPEAEMRSYWNEMREIAAKENVSLMGVSGALTMHSLSRMGAVSKGALTGARVAGGLFNRHVVSHYVDSLDAVRKQGFYETLRQSSAPYIEAVWSNFADSKSTWTEEVVTGRAIGKAWQSVKGWFSRDEKAQGTDVPKAEES